MAGWAIGRQNFGALDRSGVYKSWAAQAWLEGAQKIKNREVIIPNDDILIAQGMNRKKDWNASGKLSVEDKHDMRKRNVVSPDRWDALMGCMAAVDAHALQGKAGDRWEDFQDALDSSGAHSVLAEIGADY